MSETPEKFKYLSLPLRGAWIEIAEEALDIILGGSLPLRGAWIEIIPTVALGDYTMSLPLRGAWIEIDVLMHTLYEG